MAKKSKKKQSVPQTVSPPQEEKNNKKSFPVDDVQSIIPVKEIYKGMIITADDRYVKILEVLPVNFALRSNEEQDNIIHQFAAWLRIAPAHLKFKVITKRADSFEIINNVIAATQNETNAKCQELADNYINFIKDVSGTEALSRRFFLIFEYEPNSRRKRTIDEIAAEMDETTRRIRSSLASCGNEIVVPENEDFFQAEALYTFYNRESSAKEQFADRVIRVTKDEMLMQGLDPEHDPYPEVSVVNYIAPRGVDFTHSDYFICDGLYQSILFVKRDGYPVAVNGGWMSSLIELGDGVDVDIILRKEPRSQVKEKVSLKLKLTRIKADGRSDVDTDYEQIEGAIQSASYIKDALASGEDFYHLYTYITVTADTYEGLQRKREAVADILYSQDVTTKEIHFRLEDAFQVVSPLMMEKKELMSFASRNVMTFGAASMFPFTSCELCDENGIVLGINRRYSSLVNIDIFNTKKYKNANVAILGTSGTGKTFTELTMALRMRIQGIQTFIISPDKAHEFQRACAHINGSYVRISPGAKSCINIMEIRPVVSPISAYLDEADASATDSWLAQKTAQLLTFFHILVPDLKNEEEQLIDEAIIKTYNKIGITHDNKSVYIPGTKQLKKMPIIGNLYDVLYDNPDTKRIAQILGRFVTGSAASFNQQTNVDLTNKFIVFDLQDLQGSMKAVGMFIVMDFLWSRIKENRTERKAVFIDEGWQLIGASSDSRAADFVYRIFKTIRGYAGSAIFATQDISDLFAFQDGKYGKAIISNSKIKMVLGLEQQEAKAVRDVLQLTKNETRSIVNFNRGEALLCANNNKMAVLVRASTLEEELITTDPNQLRVLIERRKAEQEIEAMFSRSSALQHGATAQIHNEETNTAQPQNNAIEVMPDDMYSDARLEALAMEQLAESEVPRNGDGSIAEGVEYPPLTKVDDDLSGEVADFIVQESFPDFGEANDDEYEKNREARGKDIDLAEAEDLCAEDKIRDHPTQNGYNIGGVNHVYARRPPTEF